MSPATHRKRPTRISTASMALCSIVTLAACDGTSTESATDMQTEDTAEPATEQSLEDQNLATAERFIDAFYSFDASRLAAIVADAEPTGAKLLYYQGWAEGGNYKIINRGACTAETPELIHCPITVQDDPVLALKTGFNVTDTFSLTFEGTTLKAIETSSNDQPVYYQAREWVLANKPEIMEGPCKGFYDGGTTPGDCARAMTQGYQEFAASPDFPGVPEQPDSENL